MDKFVDKRAEFSRERTESQEDSVRFLAIASIFINATVAKKK